MREINKYKEEFLDYVELKALNIFYVPISFKFNNLILSVDVVRTDVQTYDRSLYSLDFNLLDDTDFAIVLKFFTSIMPTFNMSSTLESNHFNFCRDFIKKWNIVMNKRCE